MLDDILGPGLSIVFCGTAASARSAAVFQYYAGRGNKFWRILHQTGLTPRLLAPSEYRSLPRFGIGLTDIAKGQFGSDKDIVFDARGAERVRAMALRFQPRFLCFNGKRAAQEFLRRKDVQYGRRSERIGATALHVLPSTAGSASGFWDDQCWHEFAQMVRAPLP